MITCKVEHRQVQALGIRGGGPCIYQTRSQLSARYAVKGKAVLDIQGAVCGVGAGYEKRKLSPDPWLAPDGNRGPRATRCPNQNP